MSSQSFMSLRVVRLTLNCQTFACSVQFEEEESNSAFCAIYNMLPFLSLCFRILFQDYSCVRNLGPILQLCRI